MWRGTWHSGADARQAGWGGVGWSGLAAARGVAGATATPTAAGAAAKAWEGMRSGGRGAGRTKLERCGTGQRRCGRNGAANRSGGHCEVLGGDAARGTRRWADQVGAVRARPSPACGPLPRPSQRRRGGWSRWFARNVSGRLGRLSRASRTARVNRPSAAPPVRSCPAFASRRSPATCAPARPAAGCRRCRAPRSLRRSRRTTAPT